MWGRVPLCVITSRFRVIWSVVNIVAGVGVASVKITNLLAIWITRVHSPKMCTFFKLLTQFYSFATRTTTASLLLPLLPLPPPMVSVLFIDFKVEKDPSACSHLLDTFFGAAMAMMLRFDIFQFVNWFTYHPRRHFGVQKVSRTIESHRTHVNVAHKTNLSKRKYYAMLNKVFRAPLGFFAFSLCICV